MRRSLLLALLCSSVLLAQCGKAGTKANPQTGTGQTLRNSGALLGEDPSPVPRPSASLGLFVTLGLAQSTTLSVQAAMAGVEAQVRLHQTFDPATANDTFALLQEFGDVLSIDINDLLNRSSARVETLNRYVTGLGNITARSRKRSDDLTLSLNALKTEATKDRTTATNLQQRANKALKDKDYATAGSLQQELIAAQTQQATVDSSVKQTQTLLSTYQQMLALSDKRLKAIQNNRELLIAGLKVVDVPGAQELGIIQSKAKQSGTGIFGF